MSYLLSYQHCQGINNKKRPEDIRSPEPRYRPGLGEDASSYEVTQADNIELDLAGMPNRRSGYTSLSSSSVSNMWSSLNRDKAFCLVNGVLNSVNENHVFTVVTPATEFTSDLVYQEIGEQVFITDGNNIGYIENGLYNNLPAVNQEFKTQMIPGQCMTYYKGRLFVASDTTIWFSDAFRFWKRDVRHNYKNFPFRIDMMVASDDGIYVIAGGMTYFMVGDNPHKFEFRPVASYGYIKGTLVLAQGVLLGTGEYQGLVPVWLSPEGVCYGYPSGRVVNISSERYNVPVAISGAALFKNKKETGEGYAQYIATIR